MSNDSCNNVVDFGSFRRQKISKEAIQQGRVPLNSSGLMKNHPKPEGSAESLADRVLRIKASLDKINSLMSELKKNMKDR